MACMGGIDWVGKWCGWHICIPVAVHIKACRVKRAECLGYLLLSVQLFQLLGALQGSLFQGARPGGHLWVELHLQHRRGGARSRQETAESLLHNGGHKPWILSCCLKGCSASGENASLLARTAKHHMLCTDTASCQQA